MALSRTTNRQTFTAVAGDTQFTFDFAFFDRSSIDEANYKYGDIKLTRESTAGIITQFVPVAELPLQPADAKFTLTATNNDPEQGGTVTISLAAIGGEKFTVERDVAYTQQYDLQEGSTIDPTALNKAFDRVVAQNQQQEATLSNSIQFPVTDDPNTTYTVGSEVTRANKALGFDASGNVTEIDLVDAGAISGDTNAGISISNNIISAKVDNSTTQFSGGNIAVKTVGTSQIADDAVTNAKIANNSIQSSQLLDNAVTFAKMQDIGAHKVIGNVSGSTGNPQQVSIDHNLDTVSPAHDTLASALAIKDYVDSVAPQYVSIDSTVGGHALQYNATTRSSYGNTSTYYLSNFRSDGSGSQPDLDMNKVTEIHIQIRIEVRIGIVGFRASYPDGTFYTIGEDEASSTGDDNRLFFVAKIPFNKASGQNTFQLQCKKTSSDAGDTGSATIIGVTQI